MRWTGREYGDATVATISLFDEPGADDRIVGAVEAAPGHGAAWGIYCEAAELDECLIRGHAPTVDEAKIALVEAARRMAAAILEATEPDA